MSSLPAHEISKTMEQWDVTSLLLNTFDHVLLCDSLQIPFPFRLLLVLICTATPCSSSRPNPLNSDAPLSSGMIPFQGLPGDDDFAKMPRFLPHSWEGPSEEKHWVWTLLLYHLSVEGLKYLGFPQLRVPWEAEMPFPSSQDVSKLFHWFYMPEL